MCASSEYAELGRLVTYARSGFGQAPHVAARRLQSRRRKPYPSTGCWPPPPDVRRGSNSPYSGALLARTPGASQIGPTAPRKPASVLTDRHAVGPNVRSLPGTSPRVKLARSDLRALCPAQDKPDRARQAGLAGPMPRVLRRSHYGRASQPGTGDPVSEPDPDVPDRSSIGKSGTPHKHKPRNRERGSKVPEQDVRRVNS